jgi:hypothetical protein
MPTVAERLDASLREITQPIVTQLREIELEISVREEELKELRAGRLKLVTIARQIDPELAPKKEVKTKKDNLISDERVEMVYTWLTSTQNGDEFYASGLTRRPDVPTSQSQIAKALAVLHDRGQIRLTRQGSGGSKYYRLVTA